MRCIQRKNDDECFKPANSFMSKFISMFVAEFFSLHACCNSLTFFLSKSVPYKPIPYLQNSVIWHKICSHAFENTWFTTQNGFILSISNNIECCLEFKQDTKRWCAERWKKSKAKEKSAYVTLLQFTELRWIIRLLNKKELK